METIVMGSEVLGVDLWKLLGKHSIYMQLDKCKSDTDGPLIYTLI